MAELAISRNLYVKTSDLVHPIQANHENIDFYINLLIQRLDEAFKPDLPSDLSPAHTMCRFPRKIPSSSIMEVQDTRKENVTVKGILIVATVIEHFDMILHFRKECWNLAKQMYKLAKSFYQLKDYPILNDLHKEKNVDADPVLSTIVEASYECFFQKEEKKYDKLVLNPTKYRKIIEMHHKRVDEVYNDLGTQMLVYILRFQQQWLYTRRKDGTRGSLEQAKVEKTEKEIIEEIKNEEKERERKVKHMIRLLDESKENKLAVIIQGDSGQSKTDLAEAIYDRLEVELSFEGWKLYKKKITKDMEFNPNVSELHSEIINFLSVGKTEGKNGEKIQIIKNESAFIWIDNILRAQDLRKMLDMEFRRRNKVRLLVTSPNKSVKLPLEERGFICEKHEMECAQDTQITLECSSDPLLREMAREYLNRCKKANEETRKKVSKWVLDNNLVQTGFYFAFENAFLNLPASAQDAFLDICAFFVGWDWDEIPFIVGEAELETLQENAWVKRSHNNQIAVPDILRSLGLSRTKGVRLTNRDDLKNALDSNQMSQIKGIFLPNDNEEFQIPVQKLELMETLRVLSLGSSISVVDKCTKSFEKLRFLQVGRSSKNLPLQLNQVRNLRYFRSDQDVDFDPSQLPPKLKVVKLCGDAYHKGKELIPWEIENLRVLKLNNFQKLGVPDPKIFRPFKVLKELCISTCSVVELPESLTQLYFLQKLDLHDCKYLQKLPKAFGTLLHLAKLNLGYCSSLRHLPESFGQLESLEELVLSYCSALKQLPSSFVCLGTLKKATFSHCHNMQKLPDKFELLSSLEEVDFSYCKNLKLLTLNFELLSSLQLLNLRGCSKLQKLPDSFPQTLLKSKLFAIKLSGCSSLTELPDEFCQGNMIEDLSLAYCTSLYRLPTEIHQLKRLRVLNLSGCKKLRELPKSFSQLTCLEVLNLRSCHKLRNLCNHFNHLKMLRDLNLSDCPALEGNWMKTLKRIRSLRIVDIHGSQQLKDQWGKRRCHFTVLTEDERTTNNSIEKILNRTTRKIFKGKAILVDKNGRPFSPEEIPIGTTLALIFDHNISQWDREMLENNVDELLINLTGMKIIYVGKSFGAIPTKLADQVIAYTPDHSEALSLFDKPLAITAGLDFWGFRTYIIKTVVAKHEAGYKLFKGWDSISGMLAGKSFNIQDYHRLEEMIALDTPQNSSPTLLQLLLVTKEKEFLYKKNKLVTIDDLNKNMVFLLISTLEISQTQILFEMYKEMQNTIINHNLKVEWVWIPVTIADEDVSKQNYNKLKEDMPWVVISEPWLMDQSTISVFFRERMGFCEMPILVCWAPWCHISTTDVMLMVATLGSEAWLFLNNDHSSPSYSDKLNTMQSLPHLSCLFTDFKEVSDTNLRRSHMIWLYGGHLEKVPDFNSKLSRVIKQMDTNCIIEIVYVGRRSILHNINSKEEEEEAAAALHKQKLQNTSGSSWSSLTIGNVKRFWHHIHYLVYLIASHKEEKIEKLESFQRLLLAFLSLDCLSRRNGTVWMMAIDGTQNEIFTGKGKDLVDLLSRNINNSINSRIKLRSGAGEVYSSKTEGEPLIQLIRSGDKVEAKQTFDEGPSLTAQENQQTFEDALWLTAHPSSHLVEQISANMYCSMCCVGDTAYHCDACGCFSICQKCYISEFIGRSKGKRGEQINLEVAH